MVGNCLVDFIARTSPGIMTKLAALATAAVLVSSASAHTIFQKLYVNGVDQGELTGIRAPDYDGVGARSSTLLPFPA